MKTSLKKTYMVGIGASAGGLEAIQAIISNLPEKIPGVTIVIAQHLSPNYRSVLAELLSKKTKIKIYYAKEDLKYSSGKIYISPPSDDLIVADGCFRLKKSSGTGAHPSIDVLFGSIAEEFGDRSAGIILSGTGKDGTAGLVDIKSANGTVIVQDPSTAKYDSMPSSAIETDMADNVMAADEIGRQLTRLIRGRKENPMINEDISQRIGSPEAARAKILELLEQRKGIDFSDYKVSSLHRRIKKRVSDARFEDEVDYLKHILKQPNELDNLFQTLLIGVTAFFRNTDVFKAAEGSIRGFIKSKDNPTSLRLWVPACASGEEAYTYSIILNEMMKDFDSLVDYQIFATDIDTKGLHKARLGVYPASSVKQVPGKLLKKYFKKQNDGTYMIDKKLRKQVLFSQQDVSANPPFLKLDFISCRNLLIYFNPDLQKRVLPLFYYALNPGGYLILGKSENIGNYQNLFATIDGHNKIFKRKDADGKVLQFPRLKSVARNNTLLVEKIQKDTKMTIADMVKNTLYNSYDHPYVVVDESMEISEINGDVSSYIKLKSGTATLNLNKLISPEYQSELRALFTKANSIMKPVEGEFRHIKRGKNNRLARLSIIPLLYSKPESSYFLVSFQELAVRQGLLASANIKPGNNDSEDLRLVNLEQELSSTKEHMNSLIEELETSNEELQAVNEEIQASNEELQAANEELETSNEELQATNEELENAYTELREAHQEISRQKKELARSAKYMDTTLNNTLVGFVMIDRNFKVLAINQTARSVYKKIAKINLSEGDSYFKIINNDQFNNFQENFSKAIRGKRFAVEEEFLTKNGIKKTLNINYSPVDTETGDKEASYVILSMIDVTDRKNAEDELMEANAKLFSEKQFLKTLTENLPSFIWTTDHSGNFIYCNKQYLNFVGKSFNKMKQMSWTDVVHPDDKQVTESRWENCLNNKECMTIEHRLRHKSGKYKWYLTYAEPVLNQDKSLNHWVGFSTEIESLKQKSELEQSVTQLTEQRSELMKLSKAKDDFVALASHQLRTPASAVKQYIKMILDEYAGPYTDEQGRYLQTAYASNERQLNIINDLLKTAQIDGSGYNLNKVNANLAELVQQIAEELKPIFDLKNQRLELDLNNSRRLQIDVGEIKLVIENLIINANKYSYQNTKVKARLRYTKNHAKISVIDEGVGISPDNASLVFDKFTRLDNELSDTVTGTGLGLYISDKIIEAHGGTIEAKANRKKGSTFTVKIPL